MARFSELLDRKSEDITPPPLLPAGTYLARVRKYPDQDETTGRDGTLYDKLTFQLEVVAASEVDEDAISAFGKVAGFPLRHDFLFNTSADEERARANSENRLKNFLSALGVFPEGVSLRDALAASPGSTCLVEVGHRPDNNDPERFYTEVRRVFPA